MILTSDSFASKQQCTFHKTCRMQENNNKLRVNERNFVYLTNFSWYCINFIQLVNKFSFWAYFGHISHKRPPPVSDHFAAIQVWSLTRELTGSGI